MGSADALNDKQLKILEMQKKAEALTEHIKVIYLDSKALSRRLKDLLGQVINTKKKNLSWSSKACGAKIYATVSK